jgi:MFS family permease
MSQPTVDSSHRWPIMAALMAGIILSPLNVTFTSLALPTMRTFFQVDIERATWVGTAYFIPSVALMPFQAYLGERWGLRRVYALSSLLLSAGSFLAVFSPNFRWLLVSRVIQGIGWSALYPLALVLIRLHFPVARQGEMMGLWESAVGVGTIIAPLMGGALIGLYGWQALYTLLGIVSGLGAVLTLLSIPAVDPLPPGPRPDFDWPGAVQVTLTLALTLVGVARRSLPFILAGIILGWWWYRMARRQTNPFVPAALFRNGRFLSASVAANLRMLVAVAVLTALPLFFEDVQGLSPVVVGSLMVIYSLFLLLGAWPGGRWADSAGIRVPGVVGYVAMGSGVLLMLRFDSTLHVFLVAIALSVRGIGAGLTQAPYANAAVEAVEPAHARVAAGIYGTIRYSGLALGTALVGIFLQVRLAHYDALTGGKVALPAYRELWLLLAGITVLGLIFTLTLKRDPQLRAVPAE